MKRTPEQREEAFARRLQRHLTLGLLVGAVVGAGAGLVLGILAFEMGSVGMWSSLIAGGVFGVVLAGFLGGMSSLESPRPGHEPGESHSIDPTAEEEATSDALVLDERTAGKPIQLPTDPDVEPIQEDPGE